MSLTFRNPQINIYSQDVERLRDFYERMGFRETFRTVGHVELTLDQLKIGIASVEASVANHGLRPNLGGRPVEIVFWTDDVDGAYERLTTDGAPALSPPHDFQDGRLRAAWVADPDGNPIQLVQHK